MHTGTFGLCFYQLCHAKYYMVGSPVVDVLQRLKGALHLPPPPGLWASRCLPGVPIIGGLGCDQCYHNGTHRAENPWDKTVPNGPQKLALDKP